MSTLLVVEDDDETRMLFQTLFEAEGYTVVAARQGLEALELLRRIRPCVIVLDLMMPIMDGFEFRRLQLRQPEPIASIPVVCVTAVAWLADSLGLRCLKKPVDLDELVATVRKQCDG